MSRQQAADRLPVELRLLAVLAAATTVYAMRRADPDLWGYLAYGRYFWALGHPTGVDIFSYTCRSCTWIHFEWLAQVSLWLAYDAAGDLGLIVLKCAAGGVCAWYMFKAISRAGVIWQAWLPVYLLMLGVVPRFFLFRPQLYTFAFFAFFIDGLWRHFLGDARRLWILPLATALWANLHGGFLAGLGAIGLWAVMTIARELNAGKGWRRAATAAAPLGLTLLACVACSFANPQGWHLWDYLITELTHDTNRRFIEEWMPLSFQRDLWSAVSVTMILALLLGSAVVLWRSRVAPAAILPWQWLAACVPLTIMTLQSGRHVPILAIWVAPILAVFLRGVIVDSPSRVRTVMPIVRFIMAVPMALTVFAVLHDPRPVLSIRGTLGHTDPFSAVEYMRAAGITGHVFLPLWWGNYVSWMMYPRILVSMDGRNVSLYPREIVLENLMFYKTDQGGLSAPLRHDTDYLLVPHDAPVLSGVRADASWLLVFEDSNAALFTRRGRALEGRVDPTDRVK